MEDMQIIELFLKRSQEAVNALADAYGKLIYSVSYNLLGNEADAAECQNDTYLGVWNSIPPNNPDSLRAYVCRIARNLSIKRLRSSNTKKRSGVTIAMEELEAEISVPGIEEELSAKWLESSINLFISELDHDSKVLFLRRYYLGQTVAEIADELHLRRNTVAKRLSRTRSELKEFLIEEGHII